MKRLTKTKAFLKAQSKAYSFGGTFLMILLFKPTPEMSLQDFVQHLVKEKAKTELRAEPEPRVEDLYQVITEPVNPNGEELTAEKLKTFAGLTDLSDEKAESLTEGIKKFANVLYLFLSKNLDRENI